MVENGYDSDGQLGPFNLMEAMEGPQDFDEVDHLERIAVPESLSKSNGDSDAEGKNEAITLSEKDDGPGQHIPITELDKKSNKELQDELRKRGLKVGGKKEELQERLFTKGPRRSNSCRAKTCKRKEGKNSNRED